MVNQWKLTDKCEFKIQPETPEGITLKVKGTAVEKIIVRISKVEGKED